MIEMTPDVTTGMPPVHPARGSLLPPGGCGSERHVKVVDVSEEEQETKGSSEGADGDPDHIPGSRIVTASWIGTGLLAAAAGLTLVTSATEPVVVVVSVGLCAAGVVGFVAAYVAALGRSRTEELAVASVYFLTHGTPARVRRLLMGAFVVQIAVAVGASSLRPYTAMAFTVLAPMYGLGMAGLWGARHGTFPPRRPRRLVRRG